MKPLALTNALVWSDTPTPTHPPTLTHTHTHTHTLSLSDICELGYHPCHPNATCTEVTINNITQTSCSCNENFTVNGINCELIPCDCPADKMMCIEPWLPCVCAEGYTLTNNRDSCYQIGIILQNCDIL